MTDNLTAWLDNLATTTLPQGHGALATYDADDESDDPVGYCCLGVGCLQAGVTGPLEPVDAGVLRASIGTLAPTEFLQWLGIDRRGLDGSKRYYDLRIDMPSTLYGQGKPHDCPTWGSRSHPDRPCSSLEHFPLVITAAGLNDSGFTFAQIADTIRYFGIKEAV